jgi:hypothetical protein
MCSLIITVVLVYLLRFISKLLVIIIYLISIFGMTSEYLSYLKNKKLASFDIFFLALSIFLWYEFYKSRNQFDIYNIPVIGLETSRATAYLTFSLISTTLTVFIYIFIILNLTIKLNH